MREPAIFWWPGKIQPAEINGLGSTLDLLPTVAALAGVEPPGDRTLDGVDLSPVLLRGEPSARNEMFYYRGETLYAVRVGPWKAHFVTQPAYRPSDRIEDDPPELYHLERDPSEKYNVAAEHPDVIQQIRLAAEEHGKTVEPVENQLAPRGPEALR
jgi:arylsulfatase A-like enzyme